MASVSWRVVLGQRNVAKRLELLIVNLPFLGVMLLSIIRKPAARAIAGVDKPTILTVVDAHLEMLSMVLLSTIWAIGYGWVEGTVSIGALLAKANQSGFLSTYHIFLGMTIVAISFSFGLLKFRRMLIHQKRYMFFTALGNVAYSLVAQDFSYFFFVPSTDRLAAISWTCGGLGLGCKILRAPWDPTVQVAVPYWYFLALGFAGVMFFLGYRSVLVDLLVTRAVMKEVGFAEKTRVVAKSSAEEERHTQPAVPEAKPEEKTIEAANNPPEPPSPPPAESKQDPIAKIVDSDRAELIRKLRERLERQGT